MLKRDLPDKRRTAAGTLVAAATCLSSGCVIWVAQPVGEIQASAVPASRAQEKLNAKLLSAAWRGDSIRAEAAIASGADVNARTRDGTTALVIVARSEDMRILDLLLEHSADPNLRVAGDGTALVAAARARARKRGCGAHRAWRDVNVMTLEEGTPLADRGAHRHFEVVRHLAESGADVNLESPPPAPCGTRFQGDAAARSGLPSTAITIPSPQYLKSKGAVM